MMTLAKHLAFLIVILIPFAAMAQEGLSSNSNEPIEITADKSLEWNRNEQIFVARANALAKQGDSSIKAETLTAHYRESEKSNMDIHRFVAENNVELKSKDSTAYGDKADYDIDKGFAVMTGNNLKMTSPGKTVTAKDRFEYWVTEGKLNAIGHARVDSQNAKGQTETLEADTITAILKDNAEGKRELNTLDAVNNVVITTPTEKITGDRGHYNAQTNKATLTGKVVLHRGQNMLEGDRAEVDLNTNTSQLFGGPATSPSGQVRGIFYPGSEKKGGGQKSMQIMPSPLAVPLPDAKSDKAAPPQLMTAPSNSSKDEFPTVVVE